MSALRKAVGVVAFSLAGLIPYESAWSYNPMLEDFKLGKPVFAYRGRIRETPLDKKLIAALKQNGQYEDLALYVLDNGYRLDVSYYYLGEAAEGMGLLVTADLYYKQAQYVGLSNPRLSCVRIGFDVCNGLHFPDDAWAARLRIRQKARAQ